MRKKKSLILMLALCALLSACGMAQNDDAGSMQAYDTENTQAYDTESTEANDTESLQAAVEGYIKSKGDGRPSPLRGV